MISSPRFGYLKRLRVPREPRNSLCTYMGAMIWVIRPSLSLKMKGAMMPDIDPVIL